MHEKGHLSKDVSYPQLYLNYFINIMQIFKNFFVFKCIIFKQNLRQLRLFLNRNYTQDTDPP